MQYKQSLSSNPAKLGKSLALIAVVLVLLGSVVAVLSYAHQRTTGPGSTLGASTSRKATPTPKKPIGTTLYTTPSNTFGFGKFSWSPNSQRIASMNGNTVQIWDARTGKHKITIQLPGGTSAWPWDLDWSHNSQQVAIGTTQQVLIVDGLTGRILRTYEASASNTSTISTTLNTPTTSAIAYLTSQLPTGGGYGYRATVWSPNSRLMASALSSGPAGEIQVWNPQTAKFEFNLTLSSSSYNIGSLAWSSDGQYIAANSYNTQGDGDPTQPANTVVVWSVSTHQIVFQHNDTLQGSDAQIAWQPGTHNLAFAGTIFSGGAMIVTLKIWNVITGRQVKQYVRAGASSLSWSPDGTNLAYSGGYAGSANAVIILDVATGKQVYAYKSPKNYNSTLVAWSPDGRYLVSDDVIFQMPTSGTGPQETAVAHVWIAE